MSRANVATTHDNAGIAAWRFKLDAEIASFQDCARAMDKLAGKNYSDSQSIGPRMILQAHRGSAYALVSYYAITLYNTEIIRYYPDGTFSVDNGGWNTPTTSERLNAVLPDGFRAYHHDKQLGLTSSHNRWAARRKVQPEDVLWPLSHDVRIDPKTGTVVS